MSSVNYKAFCSYRERAKERPVRLDLHYRSSARYTFQNRGHKLSVVWSLSKEKELCLDIFKFTETIEMDKTIKRKKVQ